MAFELYVALRYLRAKRKQKLVSFVTLISVLGVTVGVAALVIAMAINNGVQGSIRDHLLSANAHINLLAKEVIQGIPDWQPVAEVVRQTEGVVAVAPALYGEVMVTTPLRARGAFIKGIDIDKEMEVADLLSSITEGSLEDLRAGAVDAPGIILGRRLADQIGARLQTRVTVLNPQGEMTVFGRVSVTKAFRVVAIFDSGFYEFDNAWAFTTLKAAQQTLSLGDVINAIEVKTDDLDDAEAVARRIELRTGASYVASTWMERNRSVFNALEMEKLVTAIAISLIMLVAALNILISLVMMVMEKSRDIAILKSMGSSRKQIRRIFMWQGMIIGTLGTTAGLVLGHVVCWICNRYQLIKLDAEVYGLEYVPFAPTVQDGLTVALAALVICYLITIYPSGSAARVAPVETLRYE
jgi:lipoprotein-releasing system permease protein